MLITNRHLAWMPLPAVVATALREGFAAVMLREKDLEGGALFALATHLAAACDETDAPLLVNDRLDVALAVEGAGGHVGRASLSVPDARQLLGPRWLGYSAHSAGEAAAALAAGADYVTLGPFFPSVTKPGRKLLPLDLLSQTAARHPGRVIVLGGVETPERVAEVRARGAAGAAVMGAVMRASDPTALSRSLAEAWRA